LSYLGVTKIEELPEYFKAREDIENSEKVLDEKQEKET
jgi:hypothetical protein